MSQTGMSIDVNQDVCAMQLSIVFTIQSLHSVSTSVVLLLTQCVAGRMKEIVLFENRKSLFRCLMKCLIKCIMKC